MIYLRNTDKKAMNANDPIKRDVEKGLETEEHTPLNPPDAYSDGNLIVDGKMDKHIEDLMEDHKSALDLLARFEKAVIEYRMNNYVLTNEINQAFGDFYKAMDEKIIPHNVREEKGLFTILNKRLLEVGEHGIGENPKTAIDVMEDDHMKFIQLSAISFTLFGMGVRMQDPAARAYTLDTAVETARELVELLKLHIHREDVTLFPLAMKYLKAEDFEFIKKEVKRLE